MLCRDGFFGAASQEACSPFPAVLQKKCYQCKSPSLEDTYLNSAWEKARALDTGEFPEILQCDFNVFWPGCFNQHILAARRVADAQLFGVQGHSANEWRLFRVLF